eukprot:1064723-Rhodomonas_salina.1
MCTGASRACVGGDARGVGYKARGVGCDVGVWDAGAEEGRPVISVSMWLVIPSRPCAMQASRFSAVLSCVREGESEEERRRR